MSKCQHDLRTYARASTVIRSMTISTWPSARDATSLPSQDISFDSFPVRFPGIYRGSLILSMHHIYIFDLNHLSIGKLQSFTRLKRTRMWYEISYMRCLYVYVYYTYNFIDFVESIFQFVRSFNCKIRFLKDSFGKCLCTRMIKSLE